MKTLLVAALVTTSLGTAAQAGMISLDSRADFEVNQFNDAAENSTTGLLGIGMNPRDNHRFALHTLRVDFKGNFTEDTTFRLRQRFNKSPASMTTRDNLSDSTDFAYIQHRWMEGFETQFGKFTTDIGGLEGMTSSPDLYFKSLAFEEEDPLRYATGLKGIFSFGDHQLDLMTFNQQSNADDNGTAADGGFNQNREAYGVVFKGSFMDKAWSPVLSMHEDNLQTSTTAATGSTQTQVARKYTFYSASLKYEMMPIFAEIDYLYNTYRDRTFVGETDKTNTLVGTLGYRMDNWVFKLRGENSEAEIFSAASTSTKPKQNTYSAAIEYLPTNDKHFRYHLAYVTREAKPAAGAALNHQQMIAGVRLFADFLK